MKKTGYLIWLLLIGLQVAVYYMLFRNLVEAAYQNQAPAWFNNLVQAIYPRFTVEKHRFDIHFFLQKADQVVWRFYGLQVMVLAGLYSFRFLPGFRTRFIDFWQRPVSVMQVRILSIVFYSGILFFTYEWYGYLSELSKAKAFYQPLQLLRLLHIGFPAPTLLLILCIMLWLSCVAVILNFKPVISASITTFLFILLQGWLYSFEKLDHTFSTLTYAAMIMPFLIYEQYKSIELNQKWLSGWALQLICVCIALAYLLAGLEKILISGWHWIDSDTFRSYIYLHQAPLGLEIAKSQWLCKVLPALALLFQIGFIGILILRKFIILFLIAGVGFHIGTYLLLGVGGYANPWIFVYIFFIDWDKLSIPDTILTSKKSSV
ncbi:hypothetical protein GXP67_13270 [Rhodocytophaga rosea]|uniref:HTTM domain-containing protein n=1 Tax=Rhodocytophaga rosea TaxID=2704465 RepID=A0A6C0GHV2_9BACT|nr:hypothetical protein [Rhodocytophaga rosea]QHT67527.1 hypothetical protein GXP67_13270 [Rhodocytophaga rosea]